MNVRLFFAFFFIFSVCGAKQTVCLNMIVKNDAPVISRCLESVKGIIDYWVIVDAGSNDGTQSLIKKCLKTIPGELHEISLENFGEARNQAMKLARDKGDYILFMDSDGILEFEEDFEMPKLTEDQYDLRRGDDDFFCLMPQIVRADRPWKWVGIAHEYLECEESYSKTVLANVRYHLIDNSADRVSPQKSLRNIQLLEKGLKNEPDNSRYMFYLGKNYADCGEYGKALESYQKRVKMGGWDEEVFCSKLQIAHCLKNLNLPPSIAIEAYKDAFAYRTSRIEPFYYIAELYNGIGEYEKAYKMIKVSGLIPRNEDSLFNENWIDRYGFLFQLSIAAYYLGYYEESLEACDELLRVEKLPEQWRCQAEKNRLFPLEKLKKLSSDG